MTHVMRSVRAQLGTFKTTHTSPSAFTRPGHPEQLQRVWPVEQTRFKSSTRQTGGGKGKSTKSNENRAAQTKGYLKKSKDTGAGTDGKTDRYEVIRQILYDQDASLTDEARFQRLSAIIPEAEIHETIDRAWKLDQRHRRERLAEELERQYRSVNHALEELRVTDLKLYLRVIKDHNGSTYRLQNILQRDHSASHVNLNSTGKLLGLFPRQIKLPTESLPSVDKIWDLNWKNPIDPLS